MGEKRSGSLSTLMREREFIVAGFCIILIAGIFIHKPIILAVAGGVFGLVDDPIFLFGDFAVQCLGMGD